MRYRRFGRTELSMPVFSMGGMRYQYKWSDVDPNEIPPEQQQNLEDTILLGIEKGMNHIETARGYGSSEMQLGYILPKLPREEIIVQTKVGPSENPDEFVQNFEKSMNYLQLDHVDLLAFHGVNNDELLDSILRPGGCLEAAERFRKDGRVRFIGFSTHAPTRVILRGINSGAFDYVNLHWYFVNHLNWPAVLAAADHDMGVFIISPSDKGGMLFSPPQKMVDLCKPLTPIQFNDLYCLARPQVHTLSIGAERPSDLEEHLAVLQYYDRIEETLRPIEERLRSAIYETVGKEWFENWSHGLPEYQSIPGEVNLLEILRLWMYAKSLDLTEWGKMRYNLMGNGGHWHPGQKTGDVDVEQLALLLTGSPFAARIPGILQEAHELLAGEDVKRLSQSD